MLKTQHYIETSRGGFKLYEKVTNEITGDVYTRLICCIDDDDLYDILSYYDYTRTSKCNHAWAPTDLKICVHCGHTIEMKPLIPRFQYEKEM